MSPFKENTTIGYNYRNVHYTGSAQAPSSAILSHAFVNYQFSFKNMALAETKVQFECIENRNKI